MGPRTLQQIHHQDGVCLERGYHNSNAISLASDRAVNRFQTSGSYATGIPGADIEYAIGDSVKTDSQDSNVYDDICEFPDNEVVRVNYEHDEGSFVGYEVNHDILDNYPNDSRISAGYEFHQSSDEVKYHIL